MSVWSSEQEFRTWFRVQSCAPKRRLKMFVWPKEKTRTRHVSVSEALQICLIYSTSLTETESGDSSRLDHLTCEQLKSNDYSTNQINVFHWSVWWMPTAEIHFSCSWSLTSPPAARVNNPCSYHSDCGRWSQALVSLCWLGKKNTMYYNQRFLGVDRYIHIHTLFQCWYYNTYHIMTPALYWTHSSSIYKNYYVKEKWDFSQCSLIYISSVFLKTTLTRHFLVKEVLVSIFHEGLKRE